MSKMSTTSKSNTTTASKNENEPIDLEIYYYLDFDNNQDISNIEKCLHVFINTQQSKYKLVKSEKFILNPDKTQEYKDKNYDINKCDLVKRGLIILSRMFNELKLKTKNKTWLVYIGNGDMNENHKNVSLILLNKTPYLKECNYVINKNPINVTHNMDKDNKLSSIKNLTKSLYKLFSDNRTICYNTIDI